MTTTTSTPTTLIYEPIHVHDKKVVQTFNDLMLFYEYDLFHIQDKKEEKKVLQQLVNFITAEPYFLEPMLELLGIFDMTQEKKQYDAILEHAYQVALFHVTLDKNGNWYDLIPWSHKENRSLIRALIFGAEKRWMEGKTDEAKNVFQNILKSNPGDNPGVRYQLLALLEGMTFKEFDEHMGDSDSILAKIPIWFDENAKKHPEFKTLLKIWGDVE
jgi:hypothetical protein